MNLIWKMLNKKKWNQSSRGNTQKVLIGFMVAMIKNAKVNKLENLMQIATCNPKEI